jgi:16S rRNA (uracil1498-N3)-methyltransferase
MRLTRVHVDLPLAVGAGFALPEAAASHLARVLRLQPGDACVLFNGDGHDYAATISAVGKREVRVRVDAAVAVGHESPLRITLVQGIARGETMDWIQQKATELGVGAVVPVSSERSEVRLDRERADKRLAHWRSVVVAACEQSGRASVPAVAPSQPLAEAMEGLDAQPRYLLDPQAARASGALATTPLTGCVLAVGPEGGWSPRDRGLLAQAGFEGLRLGPRVLRTETAGIAAIAVLQALRGDLA